MVCLWHTMLVNKWKELKSSNYIGLLMETAILLFWHEVAGIVALATSAALMEVELLCGTTKGFTHSLTLLSRSEALKCAVAWDQGWRQRRCLPTPRLQQAGIHFQASSRLPHCKDGCSQCQPDKRTPLGMDRHQRHDSCPSRCRHLHLAFLSQEQTGPAAPPPWNTAGGKRNHFVVHSLLSPEEGQKKQWLIFLEMCLGTVVAENLGHNKSSQCFPSA